MCIFKTKINKITPLVSKFKKGEFVDFFYRDDVYFGTISDLYLNDENCVIYEIDIAGQCPATYKGIKENQIIRIHKQN